MTQAGVKAKPSSVLLSQVVKPQLTSTPHPRVFQLETPNQCPREVSVRGPPMAGCLGEVEHWL